MKRYLAMLRPWILAVAITGQPINAIPATTSIFLWPQGAPDEPGGLEAEKDLTKPSDGLVAGRPVIRLGNVSQPTITVYPAPADRATGTAVLICPGGGYHILAMDLEGTEIAAWLNSIGITAVILKYRVPVRPGRERYQAPLQDASGLWVTCGRTPRNGIWIPIELG